jgi:hypothetical protein
MQSQQSLRLCQPTFFNHFTFLPNLNLLWESELWKNVKVKESQRKAWEWYNKMRTVMRYVKHPSLYSWISSSKSRELIFDGLMGYNFSWLYSSSLNMSSCLAWFWNLLMNLDPFLCERFHCDLNTWQFPTFTLRAIFELPHEILQLDNLKVNLNGGVWPI